MKNAHMPAMAQSVAQSLDSGMICSSDFVGGMGLSKREYFAAMAMQGVLANSRFAEVMDDLAKDNNLKAGDCYARLSVDYADALLEALDND